MSNPILNLDSVDREELEKKIADLQNKMAMIYRSGRADIYNQMANVLQQYLVAYNTRYR